MWVAVGGTALHYWNGYLADHDFLHVASERQVSFSIKTGGMDVKRPFDYTNNRFYRFIGRIGAGIIVCNIWCIVCSGLCAGLCSFCERTELDANGCRDILFFLALSKLIL